MDRDPNKGWFAPQDGGSIIPVRWQGWVLLAAYIALIAYCMARFVAGPGLDRLAVAMFIGGSVIFFAAIRFTSPAVRAMFSGRRR
jgi:hypothetical protein